jgi:hypothetical protein
LRFSDANCGRPRKARLLALRESVAEILWNNLIPRLRDRSVARSDIIKELVEQRSASFTGTSRALSDDEAFLSDTAC